MLNSFGFQDGWIGWIGWILKLVSSTFFSILVNGTPSIPFKYSREIGKGDLLAPFLFIIMAEDLGHMLKAMERENSIKGLWMDHEECPHSHQ